MIINQLSSEAFSSFSAAAAVWNRILGCCPPLASWLTSSPYEGCAVSIRFQGRTYLFTCIDIALTRRTHSKLQITLPVTLDALCWILHGHIDLVTAPLFMAVVGKEQNGYITHRSIHAGVSEGKRGVERQVRETVLAPLLETQKPCGQVTCVFMPLDERVWTQSVLGHRREQETQHTNL